MEWSLWTKILRYHIIKMTLKLPFYPSLFLIFGETEISSRNVYHVCRPFGATINGCEGTWASKRMKHQTLVYMKINAKIMTWVVCIVLIYINLGFIFTVRHFSQEKNMSIGECTGLGVDDLSNSSNHPSILWTACANKGCDYARAYPSCVWAKGRLHPALVTR